MRTLTLVIVLTLAAIPTFAQAPAAPPAPPSSAAQPAPPAPPAAPARSVVPRNIRFELTITDIATAAKPVSKTVIVTVAEGNTTGSVRSEAPVPGTDPNIPAGFRVEVDRDGKAQQVPVRPTLPLNFDVRFPAVFEDQGRTWVRANINVEYQPYVDDVKTRPATVRAASTSVFENGKKTIMLQAADPVSDRRTTIEVTATVLR